MLSCRRPRVHLYIDLLLLFMLLLISPNNDVRTRSKIALRTFAPLQGGVTPSAKPPR